MNTLTKTKYHVISIAYISLMVLCIIAGILIFINQPTSANYLQITWSDTATGAAESFARAMSLNKADSLSGENAKVVNKINKVFGTSAWEQLEYIQIDGLPPFTTVVYVDAITNETITKETYDKLLQIHIDRICAEKSFNKEFLSYIGEDLLELTPDQTITRNIILQEISRRSPVKIATKAAVPYQYFKLSFNGQDKSEKEGICNFRAVFIQESGGWKFSNIYYDAIDVLQNERG
jgi:hypothetical protein